MKAKILFPYIKSLGFTIEDIQLEKTFSIQLGKKKIESKEFAKASGRLDILCKKHDDNLFVIEVKSESSKITSSDIDQGISYARLTHSITPFLLVTNGKITKVIDVVSKEELNGKDIAAQSQFWSNGCKLSTEDELQQRYEGLKQFIGYSPENVKYFSYSQMEDRMKTIKGSISELHKKYIPDIFLKRDSLNNDFLDFLHSDSRCFALIGESGVGKTNFTCGLAERFAEGNISLFFNVTNLIRSIIDTIREDFNWIFSSWLEAPEILRRLQSLTQKTKNKVCFFFDAIDEATNKDFNLDLDDFISKLKEFPNIKVCVSSKISEWKRFLMIGGNPSYLSETLYPTDSKSKKYCMDFYADANYPEKRTLPGFSLERFDDSEMKILEEKYKRVFKYDGVLTDNIKNECKLGFMLRVVAEVYEGEKLPEVVDNVELLKRYLSKKYSKFKKPQKAERYLTEIGRILIEKEFSKKKTIAGKINEIELRKKLRLSIDQQISPELFSYNILTKTVFEDGSKLIGFYYSRIRDYVICVLSFGLPALSQEEFSNLLPKLFVGPIGQSAIGWYSAIAKREHYKILMEYKQSRALIFLNEYQKLIEIKFPKLKEQFEPYTPNKVGIVLVNSQDGNFGFYGFKPLEKDNGKLIEFIKVKSQRELWQELGDSEVPNVKSREDDFMSIDPKKAASKEIREQLKNIVKEGQLNEEKNVGLALEKAITIIYNYGDKLEISINKGQGILLRNKDFLPIKCEVVKSKIEHFFASYYYEQKQIENLIQNGTIKPNKSGGITIDRSLLDYKEIDRKTEKALQENKAIPRPNIYGDFPPLQVLSKAIETMKMENIEKINLLFPSPDISEKDINARIFKKSIPVIFNPSSLLFLSYSDNQLKKFLLRFFELYIEEYSTLIETCFPTLKNRFPFFSYLPVIFYVEASTKKPFDWSLKYGYKHCDMGKSIVKVTINPKSSKLSFGNSEYADIKHWAGLDAILHSPAKTIDPKLKTHKANEMCILRNWIYQKINEEIEYIIEEI